MKKYLAIIFTFILTACILTGCSGANGSGDVSVELKNIGTSQVLVGEFSNNSEEDANATITVTWYDDADNQLGYSVSEVPYIMAGDMAFDVFDFEENYDHYDVSVETGTPSDAAKAFYDNLTIESTMNDDGSIDYKVGGGNGEAFETDIVLLYTDENDKVIDYEIETVKGSGVVTGTIKETGAKAFAGYRMNLIPKGLML